MRIGPEPTTDRFIAVMYDKDEGSIPGNALVVDANKQFRALTKFDPITLFVILVLDLETLFSIDSNAQH